MNRHQHTKTKGFTVIELLVYTAGMLVLLAAIVTVIYYMYNVYRDTTLGPRVDRIGIAVSDRITRDIRTGISFNAEQSQLNVPTGVLSLNAQVNGSTITKYIALEDGRIVYKENSGVENYLTPDTVSVSNFTLVPINTPVSNAIHFDISIDYETKGETKTRTYGGSAILRQSYE